MADQPDTQATRDHLTICVAAEISDLSIAVRGLVGQSSGDYQPSAIKALMNRIEALCSALTFIADRERGKGLDDAAKIINACEVGVAHG